MEEAIAAALEAEPAAPRDRGDHVSPGAKSARSGHHRQRTRHLGEFLAEKYHRWTRPDHPPGDGEESGGNRGVFLQRRGCDGFPVCGDGRPKGIELVDEIQPLVAYGRFVGGYLDGTPIVTKGGMAGWGRGCHSHQCPFFAGTIVKEPIRSVEFG